MPKFFVLIGDSVLRPSNQDTMNDLLRFMDNDPRPVFVMVMENNHVVNCSTYDFSKGSYFRSI
jgi:hypothetical protein